MPSSNLVSECRNSIDILLMTCNEIDLYYRSSFVVFLEISDFGSNTSDMLLSVYSM